MLRKVFTFVTVLFLAGQLHAACTGTSFVDRLTDQQLAQLDSAAQDMPFSQGLVWRATKADKMITVVGTMHIYDPRLEQIRDRVADDVAAADLVMLEATSEDEAKLQQLIVTEPDILFLVDGPTLPEMLDEDTWQMVSAAAVERGIPGFMAAKMQPWYLSMMLSIPSCAMADMMNDVRGLDHMIADTAADAQVTMQAVEPHTTLFDIMRDNTPDDQIDMLRMNMMVPDLQQEMFVAMLDLYFAEDVGKLWELSRVAVEAVPDVDTSDVEEMLTFMDEVIRAERNRNWMPVIFDAAASHDRIVVAVGAAHLIGADGVLQFLADDGWQLDRVSLN